MDNLFSDLELDDLNRTFVGPVDVGDDAHAVKLYFDHKWHRIPYVDIVDRSFIDCSFVGSRVYPTYKLVVNPVAAFAHLEHPKLSNVQEVSLSESIQVRLQEGQCIKVYDRTRDRRGRVCKRGGKEVVEWFESNREL